MLKPVQENVRTPIINWPTASAITYGQLKGTYIGDNSKVASIIHLLDFPDDLAYSGIELFTDEKPYGLRINFEAHDDVIGTQYMSISSDHFWRRESLILFSLIDNLDYIEYNLVGDNLLTSMVYTDR